MERKAKNKLKRKKKKTLLRGDLYILWIDIGRVNQGTTTVTGIGSLVSK